MRLIPNVPQPRCPPHANLLVCEIRVALQVCGPAPVYVDPHSHKHRIAILYAGSTASNCFGGLIAAGVLAGMEGALGIRAWRWLFIMEGSVTIAVALLAIMILPNYPKGNWLLSII